MRHVRKELKSLRYEIQRQKGHLNALDRQLAQGPWKEDTLCRARLEDRQKTSARRMGH